MRHSDFHLGREFLCGDGRWRVTDVGTRTVVAIRIDQATVESVDGITGQRSQRIVDPAKDRLLDGPPYGMAEHVFDEDDFEGCATAEAQDRQASAESSWDTFFDSPPMPDFGVGDADEGPHTHWNYRLVRWSCGTVALHEVYYTDGKPDRVTLQPIDFLAGGPGEDGTTDGAADEVRRSLRMALDDATNQPILDCAEIPGCAGHHLTADGALAADEAPLPLPLPPGQIICERLRDRGLSIDEAAALVGFPLERLTELLSCKRRIDVEDAHRLGDLFGDAPQVWTDLQADHDARKAAYDRRMRDLWLRKRREADEAVRRYTPPTPGHSSTFCLQVGGDPKRMLADAVANFADAWHQAGRGEHVTPKTHVSFPSWALFVQALHEAGLDAQLPNRGGAPTSELVAGAIRSLAFTIRTDEEHATALSEIDGLMDAEPGTAEAEQLAMLTGAVHAYERTRWPSTPVSGSSVPASPWDRGALANARRTWLHYEALGYRDVSAERVAGDLAPIVPAFEAACDEVDRLRQRAEGASAPAGFTEWRRQADADAYGGRLLDEAVAAARRGERKYVPGEQVEADIARLRGCLRRTSQDVSGRGAGAINHQDSYKGYVPDIQIDSTTGTLHAVAVGISDVVHAEGRTAADLWQAFRDSVDEYLAACAEKGREPQQPRHRYTLGELLAGITRDDRPDLADWRVDVGRGSLVTSNDGPQEQSWALQLTDLDMAGIADALTRGTGAACPAQEIEVLALAPALSQGYGVDEYIAAVRHRARVLVVSGAEIGWSIVPPEELDVTVTQLEKALVLYRHVKERLA